MRAQRMCLRAILSKFVNISRESLRVLGSCFLRCLSMRTFRSPGSVCSVLAPGAPAPAQVLSAPRRDAFLRPCIPPATEEGLPLGPEERKPTMFPRRGFDFLPGGTRVNPLQELKLF